MTSPANFFAPGRINIIGEHTDYSGGYVMPAPLAYGIRLIKVRPAKSWDLISLSTGENFIGDVSGEWSGSPSLMAFVRSIENTVTDQDLPIRALEGVLDSDLPSGSGLSSSTALTSVILAALQYFCDWSLDRAEMMLLAQKVELNMGIQCGIMDQYCMWQGVREKAILLDCSTLMHRELNLEIPGYDWHILFSNVKHQLLDSPYNDRRQQLFAGIDRLIEKGWKQDDLRHYTNEIIEDVRSVRDPLNRKRVKYVIEENARVLKMEKALKVKDGKMVSAILNEGQEGLKNDYDVSCPEIDMLVDIVRNTIPGSGIRMVGGGFGGALIAFVPSEDAMVSLEKSLVEYERRAGEKGVILPLRLGQPVNRMA